MKLYTDVGNPQSLKILISAGINGQKLDVHIVKPDDKVVPYLVRNRLPVLEVAPGNFIFSPNVASSLFYAGKGSDHQVDEVLEWEATHLQPALQALLHTCMAQGRVDANLLVPLKKQLKFAQELLGNKQYVVKDELTAADVVLWGALYPVFADWSPVQDLKGEFDKLFQWFNICSPKPAFQAAVPQIFSGNSQEAFKVSVLAHPVAPSPSVSTKKTLGKDSGKQLQSQIPKDTSNNKPSSSTAENEESSGPAVTEEEIAAATTSWVEGRQKVPKPAQRSKPLLPLANEKNILVTSALPYVNNVPHLGNIIGCVLSADVFARFCRLRNYNTLYICGTDEYGTATETKALEEGVTPKEICDKYNKLHTEIYDWFNIQFDYFGRTTTQQQTQIAQDIFWKLQKKGFVLKDSIEQLQCEKCNRFLADRFVEGTCPHCTYEDARGDQCDKCGKLINAIDLKAPKCKLCKSTPVVKSTQHLFLDLPTLEPHLVKYLDKSFEEGIWSSNTKVITRSWIRDGLKPRCISRDLKWGTPVPLEGYTDKVFYVWYDAPIGYISITANYTDQWEKWWKNPKQVNLFQFMAKDNVPFHSVIFPCTLLGSESTWTMVNNLSATEYLNYEDGKFSKSRGVGVFGNDAQDTGIPADIWRFYLLYIRPESQDTAFSWDDFVMKNNSELLNNLGNFINRALMFVNNNFGGSIPAIELTDEDKELIALVTRELKGYNSNLEKIKLRDGIRNILNISRLGNQYIQANKPWVLVKGSETDKARSGTVTGLAANISCLLSVMVQPYMPSVSQTVQSQLNAPQDCNVLVDQFVPFLPAGHKIGKVKPLFQKIEASKVAELRKRFAGRQEDRLAKDPAQNKTEKAATTNKDSAAPVANVANGPASPQDVERLTAELAKQGDAVRQLKTAKAEKAKIDTEVAKLVALKRELAIAQGLNPDEAAGGGGKKRKGKKK